MFEQLLGTGFDPIHMALDEGMVDPDPQRLGFDEGIFHRLTGHRHGFGVLAGNTDAFE